MRWILILLVFFGAGPSASARGTSDLSKAFCIADDINDDYAGCENLDRNTCAQPTKRCEFSTVRGCHPRSIESCERALAKDPAFTKVILTFSQFFDLRRKNRLTKEFAEFDDLNILYAGHGPSNFHWIQIATSILPIADHARKIRFRNLGCSTFRDPIAARREWQTALEQLRESTLDRLRTTHVEFTANQLAVASLSNAEIAVQKRDLETLTQTPFTFALHWTPEMARGFEVIPSDAYTCRADLELPVQSPERKCLGEDGLFERKTLCRSAKRNWKIEQCGRYSFVSATTAPKAPRTYALVSSRKYEFVIAFTPDMKTPQALNYRDAVATCEEKHARLGQYYEVKAAMENTDLFAPFEETKDGTRWVWTATDVTDQPGFRYRYQWDPQNSLNTATGIENENSAEGFLMCLIDPPPGTPGRFT